MLVLSRRPNESIVFPELNVTVKVVSAKPGVVRLGVDAPRDLAVFRAEIAPAHRWDPPAAEPASERPASLRHGLRNRLNAMNIGLHLLRQQLEAGLNSRMHDTLDRIETEFSALRELAEGCPSPPPTPTHSRVRQALLVEDDHNERELLAGCLRMAGIEVVTAGDGSDALDYLRGRNTPDVVLLDMVLPRCDGPATIRAIRENPALESVRIYAMTGHERSRFQIAEHVDGWFEKPLDPAALMRELEQPAPGIVS